MHPSMSIDPRLFAPAAARNREPILAALRVHLPPSGTVLEVASGSGEHIVYLAEALPNLVWQPTDLAAERRASIDAWVHSAGLANVLPALPLDAAAAEWAVTSADVVLCINMIHIAPAAATAGAADWRGQRAAAGWPAGAVWPVSPRLASRWSRAMPRSMPICAAAIPIGGCGCWRRWLTWQSAPGSRRPG